MIDLKINNAVAANGHSRSDTETTAGTQRRAKAGRFGVFLARHLCMLRWRFYSGFGRGHRRRNRASPSHKNISFGSGNFRRFELRGTPGAPFKSQAQLAVSFPQLVSHDGTAHSFETELLEHIEISPILCLGTCSGGIWHSASVEY
jgi:hypothetical protein